MRGSFLEFMGHVATKVMWPMEKASKSTIGMQVMRKPDTSKREQEVFCSPGTILVFGVEGTGHFVIMTN